jgi:hypothetical protein
MGYRPRFLLFPFTDGAALAALAAAALGPQLPYGGLLFLLIPPAMFLPIVRGFGTGAVQTVFVDGGHRQFLTDWARTLAVTGVVFFPVPLWLVLTYLLDDVPMLAGAGNVILQLSVFMFPILAAFYPGHLAALAIENDVLDALVPARAAKVRRERMESNAGMLALVMALIGGFFVLIFAGLAQQVFPRAGAIAGKVLWIWLAFQIALVVGLSLRGRVTKKVLLGRKPEPAAGDTEAAERTSAFSPPAPPPAAN